MGAGQFSACLSLELGTFQPARSRGAPDGPPKSDFFFGFPRSERYRWRPAEVGESLLLGVFQGFQGRGIHRAGVRVGGSNFACSALPSCVSGLGEGILAVP